VVFGKWGAAIPTFSLITHYCEVITGMYFLRLQFLQVKIREQEMLGDEDLVPF